MPDVIGPPLDADSEECRRLVDHLLPPDLAKRAVVVYDQYLGRTADPTYSMQRACLLVAQELGLHRHMRGA